MVVAIQAGDECEHILRGLVTRPRPRVVRLPAVHGARPRSPETRRRHREAALTRYFAGARPITLEIARVGVHSLAGAAVALDTLAPGTLMALHGADGGTLALGVLESTDPAAGTLAVQTTVSASEVATITVGATTTAR